MYPTLQADPERAAWIETTAAELESFGERHRAEFDDANRHKRFPRELYRELGKLGYLGPLVPPEYGGLGGGVAEYVVISEEVGLARPGIRADRGAGAALAARLGHR